MRAKEQLRRALVRAAEKLSEAGINADDEFQAIDELDFLTEQAEREAKTEAAEAIASRIERSEFKDGDWCFIFANIHAQHNELITKHIGTLGEFWERQGMSDVRFLILPAQYSVVTSDDVKAARQALNRFTERGAESYETLDRFLGKLETLETEPPTYDDPAAGRSRD